MILLDYLARLRRQFLVDTSNWQLQLLIFIHVLGRLLQTVAQTRPLLFCFFFGLYTYRGLATGAVANLAHYAAISALSTNSLHRRYCYKPISYCNKSREPVDMEKLRLRRIRPALQPFAS